MSFRGLISGSECALPNNPLAQVLKHTESDRSAQRDRIAGPSSSRFQHLPSSSTSHASEADLLLARQFFDKSSDIHIQSGHGPGPGAQSLQALDFLRELKCTGPQHQHPVTASPAPHEIWKISGMQKFVEKCQLPTSSSWAAEFGTTYSNGQVPSNTLVHHSQVNTVQNSVRNMYHPTPLFQPSIGPTGMGMHNLHPTQIFRPIQDNEKGKGKARDDAFEAAFAQLASEAQTAATIEQVDDAKLEDVQNVLQSASLEDDRTRESQDPLEEIQKNLDIESKLSDLFEQAELPGNSGDAAQWEQEFSQLMQEARAELDMDYGASMREAWESGVGNFDIEDLSDTMKFDEEGMPRLGPYAFDNGNKYLSDPEVHSALERAKELLENNGSLSEASLLLESAIQKGDLGEGGYEAWVLLGETRCMDEREESGIRALMEGVKQAEQAKAESVGKMSLATAFTNEGYERGAYSLLMRWLRARFPGMTITDTGGETKYTTWAARERVTEAFLAVARAQHTAGTVDPDVQAGLGVLFYSASEYGRAQDCFGAALSVRPQDYLLWNRLGSSLSNDERPEEALGAYREALRLRPTYTRAIYNVGVACLNIGAAKEAADHFLSALALQETKSGDKSEQLWSTLHRALLSLGRTDLAEKAVHDRDLEAFRAEGFDF